MIYASRHVRRLALAACVAAVLAPAAAAAPRGAVFGVRAVGNPKLGYFVYRAAPGTVVGGAVTISNIGDRAGSVRVYPVDATTGQTTGTVYLTSGVKTKGVGSWITVAASTFRLAPKERRTVRFRVAVPAGAGPGQHVGGIVAEAVSQTEGAKSNGKANVQIKIRNLSIVAVEADVPGPRVARFELGGVKPGGSKGYQQLLVHISNTGNVLARPTGTLTVIDDAGATVARTRFEMDSFLPGTTIDYPVNVSGKALGAGSYKAFVTLAYAGKRTKAQSAFRVTPKNVTEVFRPAQPTAAPPGTPAAKGSGTSLVTIMLLVFGGLVVVLLGYIAFMLRRRPR